MYDFIIAVGYHESRLIAYSTFLVAESLVMSSEFSDFTLKFVAMRCSFVINVRMPLKR